jgi:KUP system potassium uptake protein
MRCEDLGDGFWHVTVHFGFVEIPDLPLTIAQAKQIERHDPISRKGRSALSRWRVALFAFMSRNSAHAFNRFNLLSNSLLEFGRRIEL